MSDKPQGFDEFFRVFSQALERCPVPGLQGGGSWDRRAAWMLLQYGRTQASFVDYIKWLNQQPKA
jgi:hypothetical protein